MRRLAAIGVLAFLLTGCSKDPMGPAINITGHWEGGIEGLYWSIDLTDNHGGISGGGTLWGAESIVLAVTGTRREDNRLFMTFVAGGFESANYTATVESETRITGSLNRSGFNAQALTLIRDRAALASGANSAKNGIVSTPSGAAAASCRRARRSSTPIR